MYVQLPEDLRRVQEMLVVIDPVVLASACITPNPVTEHKCGHPLLRVECQEWQIEHNGQPIAVDDEQERQERMDGGFGNDIGIQAVTEVDRVDIVTVKRASSH